MDNFFLLEFQFHHLKINTLAKGENFLVFYYKDKLVPPFYNLIIAFGASSCSIKITTAKTAEIDLVHALEFLGTVLDI